MAEPSRLESRPGKEPQPCGFAARRRSGNGGESRKMKAAAEAHGPWILVVDDDQNLASTLKEFLTREGYAR